jgi:phosphopantetheinyl transferase
MGLAWLAIRGLDEVLADAPPAHAAWLSATERARFAGLLHAGRKRQFLAGRWLLRTQLARAFGGEPTDWPLLERRSRPPAVEGGDGLFVSISHTGEWVAAAVADVAVGIDLEQRPRAFDPSVERLLLNPGESHGSLPPDALLQRWVAKEAYVKREAGNALPERLQRLQLETVPRERALVRLEAHEAFHFAIAVAPRAVVSRHGVAVETGAAFDVIDLERVR